MEYLVQQPATLESLAMDQLGKWIASQPSTLMSARSNTGERDPAGSDHALSRAIEVIRDYLQCTLPPKYHNKLATVLIPLLKEIEDSFCLNPHIDNYHSTVSGRFIEILFTKYISSISLEEDSIIFFPSILSKTHMLSSLTELKLIYYYFYHDIEYITEADIINLLQQLPQLKHLTLHHLYRLSNILTCITENCQLIEVLDLAASKPCDKYCYSCLSCLPNLRRLDLSIPDDKRIPGLCDEGDEDLNVAALLASSETLEHVRVGPPTTLLRVLSYMTTNQNIKKKLKLKSYIDCRGTLISLRELQLVLELCPHIQEIRLKNYEMEGNLLTALYNLQELRQLTLSKFSFRTDHVDELLKVRGRSIVHLYFENIYQLDVNALLCICNMCPNLESISLEWCCFDIETTHDWSYSTFRNLKKLSLEASYLKELGQSADEQLCFLLWMCPYVEYITFNEIIPTDEFWLRVLDRNPLVYLKELKFVCRNDHNNPPSRKVVDRIVQNSINCPEVLLYDAELDESKFV